jgi:hypothetical protein
MMQWKCNNVFGVCVELHDTVNNVKILSVAQRCFNGKFISPATIKHALFFMWRVQYFVRLEPNVELLHRFYKSPIPNFTKICPVGATRYMQAGSAKCRLPLHNYASALLKAGPFTSRCNFSCWSILCHKMAWQSWEVVSSWVLELQELTGVSTLNIYLKLNEHKQYIYIYIYKTMAIQHSCICNGQI